MVQTNELRIGNWLQYKNNPECAKYFKVQGLWKNTIAEIDYKEQVISGLSELVYEAIPLTPEILEKCGFEKSSEWFSKDVHINKLNINPYLKTFTIGNTLSDNEFLFENESMDYLHQLQNLYFALTGEELICIL